MKNKPGGANCSNRFFVTPITGPKVITMVIRPPGKTTRIRNGMHGKQNGFPSHTYRGIIPVIKIYSIKTSKY